MSMDVEKLTKPLRDLIYEMEHDDPVIRKLRSAHAHMNRARLSVGLPPLPEPDFERPDAQRRAA